MSGVEDTRVEHRPGGADGNPYLVIAAILAGIHHGITNKVEPGPMVAQESSHRREGRAAAALGGGARRLRRRERSCRSTSGERYHKLYATCRREEGDRFHAEISDRDYEWYLRAV